MPDLVLYQPDIPGNAGTMIRLAACLGSAIHIIEPAGFRLDARALKRAGMDYLEIASMQTHLNWEAFDRWRMTAERRLILLSTKSETDYLSVEYKQEDLLLLGRESSGVPQSVHDTSDLSVKITMKSEARSLNVSLAAAMVLGEAIRQCRMC